MIIKRGDLVIDQDGFKGVIVAVTNARNAPTKGCQPLEAPMTPASFLAWRIRLYGPRGVKAAADALGCSRTSIRAWETGAHKIPRYIALACAALSWELRPAD